MTTRAPSWRDQAACWGVDADIMFPSDGAIAHAQAICARCPVRAACLEYALAKPELHGVWGGASERERLRMRRQRRRAA